MRLYPPWRVGSAGVTHLVKSGITVSRRGVAGPRGRLAGEKQTFDVIEAAILLDKAGRSAGKQGVAVLSALSGPDKNDLAVKVNVRLFQGDHLAHPQAR